MAKWWWHAYSFVYAIAFGFNSISWGWRTMTNCLSPVKLRLTKKTREIVTDFFWSVCWHFLCIIFLEIVHATLCFHSENVGCDALNHPSRNSLSEICHHGRIKRRLGCVSIKSAEILKIRIFMYVSPRLLVRKPFRSLNIHCKGWLIRPHAKIPELTWTLFLSQMLVWWCLPCSKKYLLKEVFKTKILKFIGLFDKV